MRGDSGPSLPITTGVSRAREPEAAARELFDSLWRPGLGAVLFFCSPQYDLPRLEEALNTCFGDIHLVGCTTAGEITPLGYIDGSITGIGFVEPDFTAVSVLIQGLEEFHIATCSDLVQHALSELKTATTFNSSGSTFAFLMIDGMSRQEEQVASAVYNALGQIPVLGGSAGDDLSFAATYVFKDGKFHSGGAILLLVHTVHPFRIIKTEHFRSTGERMVVTEADSDRRLVSELNAEPAAREYARIVGIPCERLTPLVFAAHPLIVRVGGEYHVRSIQQANEDGSLSFLCAIDEGIVLTVAESGDIVQDLQDFFRDVRLEIGDLQLVIGCDCILRRLEIERNEVKDQISQVFLENRVIGFSTYGEQYNSMHVNQTFTGVAIGYAVPE